MKHLEIIEGKTYWIKNKNGHVLSRTVVAINTPQKGWMRVHRQPEGDTIDVLTHVFKKVYRQMGITDDEAEQILGTQAQLCLGRHKTMENQGLKNVAEINGRHYRVVDRLIRTADVAFIPLEPGYNFNPRQIYLLTGISDDTPPYPMGLNEDGDEDVYPGAYQSLEKIAEHEIVQCLQPYELTAEELTEKLLPYARNYVIRTQTCSASGIQRHLRTGYVLAARIVDALEQSGVVGPFRGDRPREILVQS